MGDLTVNTIASSSDDQLFVLLGNELQRRISAKRGSQEFIAQIRNLPVGLRAMAATYELDVSLFLDDLGWHFGNWHDLDLAEETAIGLEELGADALAAIFREALLLATRYWKELGSDEWTKWYTGSPLEKALEPLNDRAWSIMKSETEGILGCWVIYARRHPERIGATSARS